MLLSLLIIDVQDARENKLDKYVSAESNPTAEIKLLLNAKDYLNRSPVHYFILFGGLELETQHQYRRLAIRSVSRRLFSPKPRRRKRPDNYSPEATLKWLILHGADLEAVDGLDQTPLHYAVTSYKKARQLRMFLDISHRAWINIKDRHGNTPLHHSAERGSFEVIELLLSKYRADRTIPNDLGMLPLHSAAVHDREDNVLEALKVDLKQGHTADNFGRSALVLALMTGQFAAAKGLFYIYCGRDYSPNPKSWNALHFAASLDTDPTFAQDMVEICESNKDKPSVLNLSLTDELGRVPGHIAVMHNRTALIQHFFNLETIRLKDSNGNSALHLAVLGDHGEAAAILIGIDYRLHLEPTSASDSTAFPSLEEMEDTKMSDRPTDMPADALLNLKNGDKRLAVEVAARLGKINALHHMTKVPEVLLSYLPANPNGIHLRDHPDPSKAPCCSSPLGKTPLHHAVKGNKPDSIRVLRTRGANVNAKDHRGRTALYRACYLEYPECITALLEIGPELGFPADTNAVGPKGASALHVSFGYSNSASLRALLEGAPSVDINAVDDDGRTGLMSAARTDNIDIVATILSYNPDLSIKDLSGKTAIDHFSSSETIRLFLDHIKAASTHYDVNLPQALLRAVKDKDQNRVSALLDNHAELTATTVRGENVLHLAVKHGSSDIVKDLLNSDHVKKLSGFINRLDDENHSALWLALSNHDKEIVTILTENHADMQTLNDIDVNGLTIWHPLAQYGIEDILDLLPDLTEAALGRLYDTTYQTEFASPLQIAVFSGQVNFIRRFFDNERVDYLKIDQHGWSLKHCIYLSGNDEIRSLVADRTLPGPEDPPNFELEELLTGPSDWRATGIMNDIWQVCPYPRKDTFGTEIFRELCKFTYEYSIS